MTFADPGDLNTGDIATEAWFDQVRDNFVALSTWASYTPLFTQSATITKTVNHAFYVQLGDLVIGFFKMTATSAGTAGTLIQASLPTPHNLSANSAIGIVWYQDTGTDVKVGTLVTSGAAGTSGLKVQRDGKSDTLGTASDAVTVASGDGFAAVFVYQAQ